MTRSTMQCVTGIGLAALLLLVAILAARNGSPRWNKETRRMSHDFPNSPDEMPASDTEWKKVLPPEQFRILREKGTERAFTGRYWNTKAKGVYRCAGCGQPLFSSDHKFDSGTGWPSFWQPMNEDSVATHEDESMFMQRTEVMCSRCQGHLGHVFDDGPNPTGLRYCINSGALELDDKS